MPTLHVRGEQQSSAPTEADIRAAIALIEQEPGVSVGVVRDEEQNHFTQALTMKGELFLLEYRDIYGHMAADEPLSGDDLAEVLCAYAGGDDAWIKHYSWAPVEL